MMDAHHETRGARLHARLVELAERLRASRLWLDAAIADAFLAIAATLAAHAVGRVSAAEALRNVADALEAGDLDRIPH